jgi:hypothetical protein
MIRYTLKCDQGHSFDSWFASAGAYDALARAGHLSCALCGSATVDKDLMAPAVTATTTDPEPAASPSLAPQSDIERRLAALREHVEKNSDYVGDRFAAEARAIHDGESPDRPIWGEARPDEARSLIEDGVPVAPLPFMPRARTN